MASSLVLTVGATVASVTFSATDIKIRDTLLAFYTAKKLGPVGATNQQKLDAVVAWFTHEVREYAVHQFVIDAQASAEASGLAAYDMA